MKFLLVITGLLLMNLTSASAQGKRAIVDLKTDILWAGVDRAGDLFVVLVTGEVQKFNKNGERLGTHGFLNAPTLLDPLDGVQSFYFSREENVYGNLSSDLETVTRKTLDPSFAINPWLVCPALHELWLLDASDFSIKKTRLNSTTIFLENELKHLPKKKIEDYLYLREYQNYVFLLDRNAGVHVFNGLGKYVRTLGDKDLNYFSFLGEELYFIKDGKLYFIDLYTQETRTVPLPQPSKFALLNDDTLYTLNGSQLTILDFKP